MNRVAKFAALAVLGLSTHAFADNSDQQVAVRRAFGTVLPEIKFQGQTLRDCIDFLRDVSGANLHVNWKALEAAGITGDTPVNVRLREVSLRKVLTVLLSESGAGGTLTFYSSDGVIEITTTELADKELITHVYPIDDLIMEIPDFDQAPDFNLQSNTSNGGGGGGGRSGGGSRNSGGGGGGGLLGGSGSGSQQKEKTTTKAERAEALVTMIRETIRPEIWREAGGVASVRYYNGHLVVTAPRSVHEALGGSFE